MSLGYVSRSMVLETGDIEDPIIPAATWERVRSRYVATASTASTPMESAGLREQGSAHYKLLADALKASNAEAAE